MVRESLKVPARLWRATAEGLLGAVAPIETGTIAAPTLPLGGEREELCSRADQEALVAAIPGARLEVYEGGGQLVHWEQPERLARDVAAFGESTAVES